MTTFKAVVIEDIQVNRLVVLAVNEKENEINISLAQEGEVPDFLATRAITEGEEVYVTIKNRETWKVESGADRIVSLKPSLKVKIKAGIFLLFILLVSLSRY
ncbi:hypothetical protein EI200_19635 [Peribacillus simplex]|uniref:hypothetical protein n=1 Tax=Peribacillus simplex TaxID=1478 RepID=UPI000F63364E|nr:hypothetical protein [Peribacillus simplex]RRN68435.1 hypothetical protein EI200_19635 [Peribacillus simplex]